MWLVLARVLQAGLPTLVLRGQIHGGLPLPWLVCGLFVLVPCGQVESSGWEFKIMY